MNMRIGNNTDYVEIKDFLSEGLEFGYDDSRSQEFLRGTLALHTTGVTTDIRASFEISEMKVLLSDLEKLCADLKHEFVFKNLDDNVEISISPTPNGHIDVRGYLRNRDYNVKLDFSIETDQSFLPGTINQLKAVLTEATI